MDFRGDGRNRPSLSQALRERTSALHAEAERSGVINDILQRKADLRSYATLLRNLLPVYSEMERALGSRGELFALGVFAQPEIHRASRIASDLTALYGDRWERELPLLDAGERYAERVAAAGAGDGVRLVAHAYVRYFGDLSGGSVLKRLLGSSLGLGSDMLSLYDFPGISDPGVVKDQMRHAIDREGATSPAGEVIIEESIRAFEHNIDISRAVQALAA